MARRRAPGRSFCASCKRCRTPRRPGREPGSQRRARGLSEMRGQPRPSGPAVKPATAAMSSTRRSFAKTGRVQEQGGTPFNGGDLHVVKRKRAQPFNVKLLTGRARRTRPTRAPRIPRGASRSASAFRSHGVVIGVTWERSANSGRRLGKDAHERGDSVQDGASRSLPSRRNVEGCCLKPTTVH